MRAWKASGASRAAFASDKPYSERSLGWWSWKLASEGEQVETTPTPKATEKKRRRRKPKTLELVEVVEPAKLPTETMTLRVGIVDVRVGPGFDRELLGDVLEVLEARR